MERRWPEEAVDFEAAVGGALQRAGGIELARRCEIDPELRLTVVRPVLEELGLFELDVRASAEEAAAAARAMRAAGRFVCPWPLIQQLAAPRHLKDQAGAVYLRDGEPRRAEHLDVLPDALAVDIVTGELVELVRTSAIRKMPLDPFGVPCGTRPTGEHQLDDVFGVHTVLAAFWVSGALSHARDLAAAYANERRQFGRRIADFGEVQWLLSDLAVAHDGLWELACFSLARLIDGRLTAPDALALQLTMLESAQSVMTNAHQILGAIGLCEEHDLTVLDRHVQPIIRRPCGVSRITGLLAEAIDQAGFDNLYPAPATAVA
jgi:acyl-CoA dehydrogenase